MNSKFATQVGIVVAGVLLAGLVMQYGRKNIDLINEAHMGFAANL